MSLGNNNKNARKTNSKLHNYIILGIIALLCVLFISTIFHILNLKISGGFPVLNYKEEIVEVIIQKPTLKIRTIVLDSGHSFEATGAHGIVKEEEITAKTTEILREILSKDENYKVILTHDYETEASIAERREIGENRRADLFLSIHCNKNPETNEVFGYEVYPQLPLNRNSSVSYKIAKKITEEFNQAGHTPRKDSGIFYCRFETDSSGNQVRYSLTESEEYTFDFDGETYGVLESDFYPAVLIEQGYVTNQNDVDNWLSDDGCEKCANVYYKAICDYFGTEPMV